MQPQTHKTSSIPRKARDGPGILKGLSPLSRVQGHTCGEQMFRNSRRAQHPLPARGFVFPLT